MIFFAIKFALWLKLNKLANNFVMKFASIIAKNLASLHVIQNDIVKWHSKWRCKWHCKFDVNSVCK